MTSTAPRGTARALLVIEEAAVVDLIRSTLDDSQYIVRFAPSAAAAEKTIAEWRPHMAIIDVDHCGCGIVRRLAQPSRDGGPIPLIALTRRTDLSARLQALDAGVDDVITVPFAGSEFAARVRALMRRAYRGAVVFNPVLRVGDLEIDIQNREVRADGLELHLTSTEQNLLYLLAANADRPLTRDEILDHLWGPHYVAESNLVDRHIRNLRVKLQVHSQRPSYIATVPGRGYRFVPRPGPPASQLPD